MRESETCTDARRDHPSNGNPYGVNMMDDIDGSVLMNDDITENLLTRDSLNCGNPLEDAASGKSTDYGKQNHSKEAPVSGQELQVTSGLKGGLSYINNDARPISLRHRSRLFSSKELNSSIIASESTRIICSVLIALLVVLSYIDYPLLGINIVNSKSIIAMKPLYLLLVTEITVLFAHLVLERRRRFEDFEEDVSVLKEGGLNWERAVRMLERGLVAHQTIRAIFIDCSVYVVIVVCGLCLV